MLFANSIALHHRNIRIEKLENKYFTSVDKSREKTLILNEKNQRLTERIFLEAQLATLKERNRIARQLLYSLRHILMRCILQTGALIVSTEDTNVKQTLSELIESLSSGTTSIGESIHVMNEDIIDLENEIKILINGFTLPFNLNYKINTIMYKTQNLNVLYIIKKFLKNVTKRSNATRVSITLKRQPAFYKMEILENGTIKHDNNSDGPGLKSICERDNKWI